MTLKRFTDLFFGTTKVLLFLMNAEDILSNFCCLDKPGINIFSMIAWKDT